MSRRRHLSESETLAAGTPVADRINRQRVRRSRGGVPEARPLSQLPLGTIVLAAFVLLVVLFLATTLDSSAYTMAAASSRELPRGVYPARWHRVFWAVVLAAVSIALMYAGGLEALQTLSIITAFPLIFVLALVAESLRRWLKADHGGGGAAGVAVASDSSSEAVPRSESPTTTEEPRDDRPVATTSE
ncbi:BCCT family transporter [Actinopolyspora lacussalsi]|uniref:BCCT family transporter n=1 Tax=Actinopolyspora righensis TaxID=995060 RepID=UPI001FEAD766|nr:BCCT family transporter [Actinopolyspora righensis]